MVTASVDRFSVKLNDQCSPFLMTSTSRKRITLSNSISIIKWMEGLKTIKVDEDTVSLIWTMWPDHKCIIYTSET
jgi:hypothetical protein